MHNLLKLILIHHLEQATKSFACFFFLKKKKIHPTDQSDRITQVKTFDRNFVVKSKSM